MTRSDLFDAMLLAVVSPSAHELQEETFHTSYSFVLELFVRELPRKSRPVDPEPAGIWYRDFAWFTKEEFVSAP
jgi:hypothetical protein